MIDNCDDFFILIFLSLNNKRFSQTKRSIGPLLSPSVRIWPTNHAEGSAVTYVRVTERLIDYKWQVKLHISCVTH